MKIATRDFRNYMHYERGLCRMTHTQMIAYMDFVSQLCYHVSLCNQDVVGLIPSCYMPVMLVTNANVHPDLIYKGKQHMVCNITAVKIKNSLKKNWISFIWKAGRHTNCYLLNAVC